MKVIIVDDQTIVRDGLVTICERLPDVEVVAAVGDGRQALAAVAEHSPDVVLMDLRMPHMDGIEATRHITMDHPGTHVVVLTTFIDDESINAALTAGALGYLTKEAGREDVDRALRAAARGQALLDPVVHARLVALARQQPAAGSGELPAGLTAREAEVLICMAKGLSNREIARSLFVSEATVKTHVNRVFAKTGSRDRGQAIAYAHRHGLG
ncbi:response regulator transcription factor [Streptomyces sp. 4503]|uniref:Response regulator transcription factor n=1 Tax=Streptomyces niphimycinicus TaxID=2842201 RepID=A0ABS6CDG4_9ACTN|nr:response regulator transcription factor [Streptomyces niphimycinicus]MBU3864956.1 response regulator transcription factor [Streptomyces niphimycinicus]